MPRLLKVWTSALCRSLGYELIPTWRLEGLGLETHLRELFKRLAVSCVVDVGANEGQYGSFLRNRVGYEGKIVSFEPVQSAFAVLEERAKGDREWIAVHAALGSDNGHAEMNVTARSTFSSLLEPDPEEVGKFAESSRVISREKIAVYALDSLFDSLGLQPHRSQIFLKTDTQGYDLEVVRGARQTLDSVCGLQMELSLRQIYRNAPSLLTVIPELEMLGFYVSSMHPLSADPDLRIIELDAVFVKISVRDLTPRA